MIHLLSNECQTPIEDLHLEDYPDEVVELFYDFITNVPFIKSLIAKDRPRAKDLPRDEEGKIIVDITNPHILEDMDYFRPSAIHWLETGRFTDLHPNKNPNSEYYKWYQEEKRRIFEGYVRESDGEWIPGDLYWYWNYSPIELVKLISEKRGVKGTSMPKVWDGTYLKAHYIHQAKLAAKHTAELASRGRGKSYYLAAMTSKRLVLGAEKNWRKNVETFIAAYRKDYLNDDGIINKIEKYMDFLAENTQFPRRRLISSLDKMHYVMGYVDNATKVKRGSKNELIGISMKDSPAKLRGKRGALIGLEEFGSFNNLIELYGTLRPSMEEGDIVYGMIMCLGCVCAGTKVFDKDNNLINIEDAKTSIIGYNGESASVEDITYLQPEAYKECVEIVTTNGSLRCSIDHPLLKLSKNKTRCSFYRANELKVGDILLMHGNNRFGDIHTKDAYLLGSLYGDGSYSDLSCVTLSITTEELYEYYNSNYDIGISKLRNTQLGGLYALIYFRGLHPLLKEYQMDNQSFDNKKLPYNIWQWDKGSIADFLAGYFDADGNILIVKKKHRSIKLTCKYKETLQQISILLQKFNIYSYILEEQKPSRILHSTVNSRDYKMKPTVVYVLYICNGIDIIRFRDNIHLKIKYKKNRLDSYIFIKGRNYFESLGFVYREENKKGKYFIGKSLKDLKGTKIISITNIGIRRIYNLTANTTHTYLSNGFISSNTAGDSSSDFAAAQLIMYGPDGFNVYSVPNVYDKYNTGRKKFVYFFPAYLNRSNCYDINGNSDVTKALLQILMHRYTIRHGTTNLSIITKSVSEEPIVPLEAILRAKGGKFPTTQINERISQLENNSSLLDDVNVGALVIGADGKVKFTPTTDTPIRDYPLKKDDSDIGAFEIYEMPLKNPLGEVYPNRYILGHDPVDDDEADSVSLSSTVVIDLWTDRLVAECTGRLDSAEANFERCRLLCMFYNGKCLYENNKKGMYAYFKKMNSLKYLLETPLFLKDLNIIKVSGTLGNSIYGVTATLPINNFADDRIKDWLMKPVTMIQKDESGEDIEVIMPNLYTLKSLALLKECSMYNPDINVDRIRALGMAMIAREEKIILYGGDLSKAQVQPKLPIENDDFFNRYKLD